jgi:hypothetical protein
MMGTLLFVAVAGAVIGHTQYFHMAMSSYRSRGLSRSVTKAVEFQVEEWGELGTNVPQAKLPTSLRPGVFLAGILAIVTAGVGMWRRRTNIGALEIYVVGYMVILLAAPWEDARYLLPLVPLLLGYIAVFVKNLLLHRVVRFAVVMYLICFSFLGITALAYSTRITFSGESFPDVYGDSTIRATYRAAFRGSGAESKQVSPEALELLRRYEPRASR